MAYALQVDVDGRDRLGPVIREAEAIVERARRAINQDLQELDRTMNQLGNTAEQTGSRVKRSFAQSLQSAGNSMSSFGAKLSSTGMSLTNSLTIPLAALTIGIAKLDSAAQHVQVAEAFQRSALQVGQSADLILASLRKASAGTVSDSELMLSANRAFALGVAKNAEEFTALMEIARDRSRVMGISVTQAFDDIVTGLGRGSPFILDNLGLIVNLTEAYDQYAAKVGKTASQLTEAEQKQALINNVMDQATRTMDRSALATRTQAEETAAMRAELANTTDELLRSLLPVLNGTLKLFNAMPDSVKFGTIALIGLGLAAGPVASTIGVLWQGSGLLVAGLARLIPALAAGTAGMTAFGVAARFALIGTGIGALIVGGGFLLERFLSQPSVPSRSFSGAGAGGVSVTNNFNNPTVRNDDDLQRMAEMATLGVRRASVGVR